MTRTGLIVALGLMMAVQAVAGSVQVAAPTPPSLARFDEDVAVCRRVIRQYCAIVQDMAKESSLDEAKQEEGLALLADARAQWTRIQDVYGPNPPAEYAADTQFKARLQDVADAVEDMETALGAGQPRRSMLACGYGCGLFVTMHEENGLVYAMDKLFHLRKTGKTAASAFKVRGLEAVRPLLPTLLRQRDDVLLAPCPWPAGDARSEEYLLGLRALSTAVDELATASAAGSVERVGAILAELTPLINVPYGVAL